MDTGELTGLVLEEKNPADSIAAGRNPVTLAKHDIKKCNEVEPYQQRTIDLSLSWQNKI